MIQTWLQERRTAAARAARLRTCPRCGAPILVGLDDDCAARTIHADPTPITAVGEALALLQGLETLDLVAVAGARELWRRDEWHIRGERKHPVIPEHRCGNSFAAHIEHVAYRPRCVSPENPPF